MNTLHVNLRELDISDAGKMAELINNKAVWDNLDDKIPFPYQKSDALSFIKACEKQRLVTTFAIECGGRFCGVIGIIVQSGVFRRSGNIGYWVGEPFWGQGVGTKAVKLMTVYGFCTLKLVRIFSGVFEYNLASMRVLEKNGYQKDAIFQKAIYKNGKLWDEYRYFKLNEKAEM